MKIAVPVKDNDLTVFGNAGHTPKFAIFTMQGAGMFKSFTLDKVIDNPRSDIDHEHADEDHECNHSHDDQDHINQHRKMGDALNGCSYIVVKKACKNTVNSMKENGINVIKYSGQTNSSQELLKEVAAKLS